MSMRLLWKRSEIPPSNPERPLRYALIGAGSAARTHLNDFSRKANLRLVAIADPAPRQSWSLQGDFGSIACFTESDRLLREMRPDVVSVCTPPRFHHEITLQALHAGAHVVCEKPMAMNLEEALQMEQTRAAVQRLGLVNFSYRNVAAFRFAKHLIRQGALGVVTRISAVYLQSFMRAESTRWSWRHDIRDAGFGALGDLGVHMIDGVRFLSGLEFRRVIGIARTGWPEKMDSTGRMRPITTDTDAMFLAEMDGHAQATLETTQSAPGYGNFLRIEVSGERGTLSVNNESPNHIQRSAVEVTGRRAIWKTDFSSQPVPIGFPDRNIPSSPGVMIDAIRGGNIAYPTFADGVAAQLVLHALRQSIMLGTWAFVQ
jgi:predicted dehydrogenase